MVNFGNAKIPEHCLNLWATLFVAAAVCQEDLCNRKEDALLKTIGFAAMLLTED